MNGIAIIVGVAAVVSCVARTATHVAWVPFGDSVLKTSEEFDNDDEDRGADVLPEISVEILGPIWDHWPRGYDWATKKQDQPRSQIVMAEPHELVIRVPSGRVIRHPSKATFFNQRRGIVTRTSLMPHLGGALRYQEAIALLETILKQWDAEPLEHTEADLDKWKAEGEIEPYVLARREGSAVLHSEEKAGIFFQIRPTTSGGNVKSCV
jgi:hypothetical protein